MSLAHHTFPYIAQRKHELISMSYTACHFIFRYVFSSVKPTQQAPQYPFQKRVRHSGKSLGLKLSTTYSVQVRASHLISLSLSFLICKTGTILLHQSWIWLYISYFHSIINIMLYHLINRHNVHNIFNEHPYVPGTVLTLHISYNTQDRGGTQ